MANAEHLKVLNQGVAEWNEWVKENPKARVDFSGADLRGAKLAGASLFRADLTDAKLAGASLFHADLTSADLTRADLSYADVASALLTKANLGFASLNYANLSEASLSEANLGYATLWLTNLTGANLKGVDLSKASFGGTVLANVDLSEVKGSDTVRHRAPSTIGIDTLYKSGGKISELFLRGCGVPDELISYIPSHIGARQAIQFYSCFISHSVKDTRFCERLYADLQAKKVRVWYFPEDAKWGESVWGEIDQSIKIYDKLVVVSSRNSLRSAPVLREIQRALNREDREGRNVLFPIRIDDYIFKSWEHERSADVLCKVVGNFTGWQRSAAKYEKAFEKLLQALQAGEC